MQGEKLLKNRVLNQKGNRLENLENSQPIHIEKNEKEAYLGENKGYSQI